MGERTTELERFRAAIRADATLQDELQAYDDRAAFVAAALPRAAALEIELDPADLNKALSDDPIGLSRYAFTPTINECPQDGWLPVHVSAVQGQAFVDWAYFGERGLTEPFFEESVRRALRRPINKFVRFRTPLARLERCIAQRRVLPPTGFIFHMSRCGSTLVSQMLAADARNIVISEASPLDAVVRCDGIPVAPTGEAHGEMLAAMICALGSKRSERQSRYFVKLDSWHALSLPLFRHVFPSVPWIFLYREPYEVLASQMAQRGIQTVPEYLPPALFGLTDEDTLPSEEYCARVLGRTCQSMLQPYAKGGGLLVNYCQLPEAVWSEILPHFGIDCDEKDRKTMNSVAHFDAKTPGLPFSVQDDRKRKQATSGLHAAADRHMGPVYRELESLRLRRTPGPRGD